MSRAPDFTAHGTETQRWFDSFLHLVAFNTLIHSHRLDGDRSYIEIGLPQRHSDDLWTSISLIWISSLPSPLGLSNFLFPRPPCALISLSFYRGPPMQQFDEYTHHDYMPTFPPFPVGTVAPTGRRFLLPANAFQHPLQETDFLVPTPLPQGGHSSFPSGHAPHYWAFGRLPHPVPFPLLPAPPIHHHSISTATTHSVTPPLNPFLAGTHPVSTAGAVHGPPKTPAAAPQPTLPPWMGPQATFAVPPSSSLPRRNVSPI